MTRRPPGPDLLSHPMKLPKAKFPVRLLSGRMTARHAPLPLLEVSSTLESEIQALRLEERGFVTSFPRAHCDADTARCQEGGRLLGLA